MPRVELLRRFWLEFDLDGSWAEVPEEDRQLWLTLAEGVGVTGYDLTDCLAILERTLGRKMPVVTAFRADPVVDPATLASRGSRRGCGNPAWRGVWYPPLNLAAPYRDG